jgi:hypothetical protein
VWIVVVCGSFPKIKLSPFRKPNDCIDALVYVSACWSAWQVGSFFIPEMFDSVGNLSKRIVEEREYLAASSGGQQKTAMAGDGPT